MCCSLARDVPDVAFLCVLGNDNGDEFTHDVFNSFLHEHVTEQNGKMEHFWGKLARTRPQNCTAWIIADIVQLYDTKWIHRALQMTPEAAQAAGINCRAQNATIDVQIEQNLECTG
jgi:hypothetical protein